MLLVFIHFHDGEFFLIFPKVITGCTVDHSWPALVQACCKGSQLVPVQLHAAVFDSLFTLSNKWHKPMSGMDYLIISPFKILVTMDMHYLVKYSTTAFYLHSVFRPFL
jgi:hypothetical protein